MDFNGTFELEDTTVDEVWLALSDPVMIRDALPGCEFLLRVEDEDPDFEELRERAETEQKHLEPTADEAVIADRAFGQGERYAALMQISVGSVSPTFETVVTIDEREKPRMEASGEGSASNSSFEMDSWMELSDTGDGGVAVEWGAHADVFGRIAQMGQRVMNPVANRVVKRFFGDVQTQLRDLELDDEGDDAGEGSADAGEGSAADAAAAGETGPGSEDGEAGAAGSGSDPASGSTSKSGSKSGGIVARIKRLLGLGG